MTELLNIIKGTPFYVWFILFYLLFIGVKSLNTRIVYLPKLFIIPLVLLAIKYRTFLEPDSLIFTFTIMLSSIVSFFAHNVGKIKIIKNSKSVELPGGYSTMLILLAFFAVKYFFGYLKANDLVLALKYALMETVISGVFSGYFVGRASSYTYKYLRN